MLDKTTKSDYRAAFASLDSLEDLAEVKQILHLREQQLALDLASGLRSGDKVMIVKATGEIEAKGKVVSIKQTCAAVEILESYCRLSERVTYRVPFTALREV